MTQTPNLSAISSSFSTSKLFLDLNIFSAVFTPIPSTFASELTEAPRTPSIDPKKFNNLPKITGPTPSERTSLRLSRICKE